MAISIARQLAPQLRPRYVALPIERFVVDDPDDIVIEETSHYPDVGVVHSRHGNGRRGGAVVIERPLQLATVMASRVPHTSVEIRDVRRRRLITAIEILSPTNKRGRGRREYLEKREKLLGSPVHLLEIDLIRAGRRIPMQQTLPAAPYFVFLSRAEKRPVLDVWPINFRDPLPVVPVPFKRGDVDVHMDLQKTLADVYDSVGYDLLIDYTQSPNPPLPPDERAWARRIVRTARRLP